MTDDVEQIEFSPLCESTAQGNRTTRVEIFRLPGQLRWSLAAFCDDAPSIVWSNDFATDREAHSEFCRRLEEEGMPSLLETESC